MEAGGSETVVIAGATAPLVAEPEAAESADAGAEAGAGAGAGAGAEAGTETAAAPEAKGEAASRSEKVEEAETAGRGETAAPSGAEGAGAGAGVMAAASGGTPPEAATATDKKGEEPPTGRPTKSLLAAAAIGGVLLIAVPLLAFAANDDDEKEKAAPVAAGVTLPDKEEAKAPGLYRAKSPEPSKSAKKPKAEKKADEKHAVAVNPGPPVTGEPEAGKTAEAKGGKAGEAKGEEKTEKEQKPQTKKAVVPDASFTQNKVLRNNRTGMCADLPAYGNGKVGGEVNEYYCDATSHDNQLWNFDVKLKGGGPRSANLFVIRNSKDGLCMDLPGTVGVSGGGIIEGLCDGSTGDNQLWWLESRGNGLYWIHNFASDNRCLEVWGPSGGGGYRNSRLSVTGCNPADDHEWRLG
ncbi:RICIN domain-containing protein [Streptomyces sp. NPDC049954]|uniref:RICIN domain-containing protein n=1 Tax=Streptomyces sp. NPDC049954 TaxID=3155779 RepID=UPI0034376BE0